MVQLKVVGVEDEKSHCCEGRMLTMMWRFGRKPAVEIVIFRDLSISTYWLSGSGL